MNWKYATCGKTLVRYKISRTQQYHDNRWKSLGISLEQLRSIVHSFKEITEEEMFLELV